MSLCEAVFNTRAQMPTIKRISLNLSSCTLQVGNFLSHVILSSLRKRPSDGYSIPRGFLFNYVTCANYTFEIWGWILFSVATKSLPAAIFCACGSAQMAQWAVAKHKRLKRLFDGKEGREKYPRRWIIFPPLL
jgi:very-long-chain enoyl-CoA reductase